MLSLSPNLGGKCVMRILIKIQRLWIVLGSSTPSNIDNIICTIDIHNLTLFLIKNYILYPATTAVILGNFRKE